MLNWERERVRSHRKVLWGVGSSYDKQEGDHPRKKRQTSRCRFNRGAEIVAEASGRPKDHEKRHQPGTFVTL